MISLPSCPSVVMVRMLTMRSPFRPAILAQSSGLVLLGRSSFSSYSWRMALRRSSRRMPFSPVSMTRLIAYFLALETMP